MTALATYLGPDNHLMIKATITPAYDPETQWEPDAETVFDIHLRRGVPTEVPAVAVERLNARPDVTVEIS